MFVTLLIAGEDEGQLRPGLARALAEGEEIRVIERQFSAPVERVAEAPAPAEATVVAAAPVQAAPVQAAPVQADPAPGAAVAPDASLVTVAYTPDAAATEPAAVTRRVIPEPVFTLSALPSLGGDQARIEDEAAAESAGAAGNVWYVDARSVNVRQGPSTETSVVGKLSAGEAVTVIAQADADWVQIVIEGDGLEGYVAARFLSPSAP